MAAENREAPLRGNSPDVILKINKEVLSVTCHQSHCHSIYFKIAMGSEKNGHFEYRLLHSKQNIID
jgi:hypothetical protein